MTRSQLEAARARYRRTYDRLYVASMRAGSKEECDRIDAKLREANEELAAAEAMYAATEGRAA